MAGGAGGGPLGAGGRARSSSPPSPSPRWPAAAARAPTGRAAPPLPAKALRPPGVDLAELRGKPALVDFFASWCGPCAEEAPTLRKLSAAVGGKATVVAVDWDDADGAGARLRPQARLDLPGARRPCGSVGESYGVDIGLPTSFVLDPQGRIVATFRGPQSEATLRRALLEAA